MEVYMDVFSIAYELFLPFLATKVIEDQFEFNTFYQSL